MAKIIVVGLGPGSRRYLTEEARLCLSGRWPVFFRTASHPAARYYLSKNEQTYSFDSFYCRGSNFEAVYRRITRFLLNAAKQKGTICYAVPGHPSVGEAVVEKLLKSKTKSGINIEIAPGVSFLEPVLLALQLDLLDGVTVIDALAVGTLKETLATYLIMPQVYSRSIASKVKLKLLELYPADHLVTVVSGAGMKSERINSLSLAKMDHRPLFNHYTTICLPPLAKPGIGSLIDVMSRLRAHDGCPWDGRQSHQSLRQYVVEEAYEVVAAIDSGSDEKLVEELGDLLLQVIFHSQIAREEERFNFYDVIEAVLAKLIRRHPHVFGSSHAENASDVKVIWEQVKAEERNEKEPDLSLAVDQGLPGLLRAYKIQKKASSMGFDWPTVEGPLEKVKEELSEMLDAWRRNDRKELEEELGDYLFTIVNLARFFKVNPELALGKATEKFISRFHFVLEQVRKSGNDIGNYSLEELDRWWNEAKKIRK